MRLCLVTAEFHGLFKNGGIGTANTGLALTLAKAGHDVTVAYVDAGLVDYNERVAAAAEPIAAWAKRGVRLEFVPRDSRLRAGHDDHAAASFAVLRYLKARDFETVFFNECGGQGYYSLLAKKAGLFPNPPRMVVVTHGCNAWVLELNSQLYWGLHPISVDWLERRSAELADDLVSPSAYLVDWMRARGWKLPASTRVVQNCLPVEATPPPATAPIREIVFFGRLEARKGVDLFLEAVSALNAARDLSGLAITFLGKFSRIEGVHSGVHILERTRLWPVAPTLIVDFGQEQALDYLRRPGVLAVMPSRAENSPCVVAECLLAGVRFIATDSGGTAELVAEADRPHALCVPEASALAATLAAALDSPAAPAALAVPQETTRAAWLALLDAPAPAQKPAPPPAAVSLCLALEPGEILSPAAWEAFSRQPFAEILISAPEAAKLPEDPRLRRLAAKTRAEGRNLAAQAAAGPWLMFADERDVILRADALAGFLAAAQGLDAEIVTSPALAYNHAGPPREDWDGELPHLPTGANLPLAAYEPCLGDACFLIDRVRFLATGGFAPEAGDRLLLTRAVLAGAWLDLAAEPLFWRRDRPAADTAAQQRQILAAFAAGPVGLLIPALESVAGAGARTRDKLASALADLSPAARELAQKLCTMPQRDPAEQNRPFLDYCLALGRAQEASAFAQALGDPELIDLARAGAKAAAEQAVVAALDEPRPPRRRPVSLMRLAAERARAVAGLAEPPRSEEGAIVHALGRVVVVKAAAVCPPGARRLDIEVGAPGAEAALVVCDRFARLRLEGDALTGAEPFAWTGWRPPGPLTLALETPFSDVADLMLLTRGGAGRAIWRGLSVEVTLQADESASAVELPPDVTPLPHRLLAEAELLTPAADFTGRYFRPGAPTLHHPLVGRPALVRLPGALYQGATGFSAAFGLEHENSRPVEFALWARRPGPAACDVAALRDSEAFSGWRPAPAPFRRYRAALAFRAPLRQPLDLYLATRVPDIPDNSYCHAVWHELCVVDAA